jgi:hypothetical protein
MTTKTASVNFDPNITSLPVERCHYGAWIHPALDALHGEREIVPDDEFNQWMDANGLEHVITIMDQDEPSMALAEWETLGSFSAWEPEKPDGDGWFVGSIHDTEDDGPVCMWFRSVEGIVS